MTTVAIREIICVVRGGPESRETVNRAIAMALESGAKLTFFHVVIDVEFLGNASRARLKVVYRELQEMGEFVMLVLCDRARRRGVTQVDYLLGEGPVRTQLRKLAVEARAEVLVIGRPTRSSTKNLFEVAEFDLFVKGLEEEGHLRVVQVEPNPVAEKDLQSGLNL